MMRHLAAAIVLLSAPATAHSSSDVTVSVAWLNQHLHDRDLVIVQGGRRADYESGHVAGARLIDGGNLESSAMGSGASMDMSALPAEAEIHGRLEKLGISNGSHVVVVYSGESAEMATRVIFLMKYAGLENVSLLDGGVAAWQRAGLPLTRITPAIVPGHVTVAAAKDVAVDYAFVQSHRNAPHIRIIDAREPVYFDGAASRDMGMAAGHVPGAHNIPFNTLFGDDGLLLAPAALEARFRAAGVQPGDTVIAYCHVGIQATAVVLSARLIGQPVKMYTGSFHDWSARKLPTEGGKP